MRSRVWCYSIVNMWFLSLLTPVELDMVRFFLRFWFLRIICLSSYFSAFSLSSWLAYILRESGFLLPGKSPLPTLSNLWP